LPEITIVTQHLPDNIQDLSKFVLVGREKLVSVRAEIRAIEKLNIAEEVRSQKREEAAMLSEALLDAEVRIGELLKQLPKDNSFKGNQWQKDTAVQSPLKTVNSTVANNQRTAEIPHLIKPKQEVVQDLGFTTKQAQRFETLASNKDIVEQVKAEARENEDIPTRSRVLQLVKEKNKPQLPTTDFIYHATRAINEAISNACLVKVDKERLDAWLMSLKIDGEKQFQLQMINDAIENLRVIKAYITKGGVS
jgi:hypothetical protein